MNAGFQRCRSHIHLSCFSYCLKSRSNPIVFGALLRAELSHDNTCTIYQQSLFAIMALPLIWS